MRVAFATLYDLSDIERGSGSYYFLARELEACGHEVTAIVPRLGRDPLFTRLVRRVNRSLGYRYRSHQDFFIARRHGALVSRATEASNADVLLTNDYGVAAFTQWHGPTVLFTDAIFPSDYGSNRHPWLGNLSWSTARVIHLMVRRALRRVALCCVPTSWAVERIMEYGEVDPNKVVEIPFGANFERIEDVDLKTRCAEFSSAGSEVRCLFVGKDWVLKGGHIAIEVVRLLRQRGFGGCLDVVGPDCISPPVTEPWIRFHGYLNKNDPGDCAKLKNLYRGSHVFLLPTCAEGFGVAFAEASAYGVPSLSFDTMGLSSVVRAGINGSLIPMDSENPEVDFVEEILSWRQDSEIYENRCKGARRLFEERFNWKVAARNLQNKMTTVAGLDDD